MWTPKKIILILIPILVISLVVGINLKPKPMEYITAQVDKGQVRQTVEATGSVASSQAIELNFKTVGRLQNIYVQEGDKIKAGQKLANLEAGALYSRVKDAQSSLLEAQANLEKLLAGATPEDIQVTQATVEQQQQAVATAENTLNNLKHQAQIDLDALKKTAVIAINNQTVIADAAMQEVGRVLNDDDAQDSLAILNSVSLTQAKNSQQQALNILADFKLKAANISENSADQAILSTLDDLSAALDKVRDSLSDVFVVLQNTVISAELSQSKLDSLISSINTQQANISTARTTIHNSQSNWLSKKAYYQEQITQAEDNLKSAQRALAVAQAQLALKTTQPQSYDIKVAQARVAKAQAALALAQANLNDTIIYAPVDGTITKINYEMGEQTTLTKPAIEMIGESPLEIEVDVPESDIAKVKLGQPVEITLDSFGDERLFQGTVIFIDPAETIIQDVVYYKVKVQFKDKDFSSDIKPGMTANVTIIVASKDNVLRAPLRALKQENNQYFTVDILINHQQMESKVIQVGLKGDDYFEIINGLKVGDKVVTFIKQTK